MDFCQICTFSEVLFSFSVKNVEFKPIFGLKSDSSLFVKLRLAFAAQNITLQTYHSYSSTAKAEVSHGAGSDPGSDPSMTDS